MTNKLLMHFVCILLLLTQSCGKNYNSQSSSLKEITLASDCLVSPDGDIVYFYKYPNDVVWQICIERSDIWL